MRIYWGSWIAVWAGTMAALLLAVVGCSCPSCSSAPEKQTDSVDPYEIPSGNNVKGWQDPASGCRYLRMSVNGGTLFAPRLNSRGLPDCPGTKVSGEVPK